MGVYDDWLKKHIVVINIGGRYFDNFLKIYDSTKPEALALKVACITDRDPVRKEIGKANARFESCKPSEYNADTAKYEYGNHSEALLEKYKEHPNIRYFSQGIDSCTLEYDIALNNPNNKTLLVPSIKNSEELKGMMDVDDMDKTAIASRYLESVSKGVNALELSNASMDLTDKELRLDMPLKEWLARYTKEELVDNAALIGRGNVSLDGRKDRVVERRESYVYNCLDAIIDITSTFELEMMRKLLQPENQFGIASRNIDVALPIAKTGLIISAPHPLGKG